MERNSLVRLGVMVAPWVLMLLFAGVIWTVLAAGLVFGGATLLMRAHA